MYKSDYERSITKEDVRIKRQVLLKRKRRCYGRQKLKCYLLVPVAVKSLVE